jgi:hypothetical protein
MVAMQGTVPSRADGPAALVMAVLFLCFGLFAIVRPERLRTAMGNFADSWKRGGWHPYRMPLPVLRVVVGAVGIVGAALFLYIGYVALTR